MKSITRPEIYILLYKGYKPRQIIKLKNGIKTSTIYAYSARMPEIMVRLKALQKQLKEVKKRESI